MSGVSARRFRLGGPASGNRWTLSFADLCLVLLAFLLMLQAQRSSRQALGAGIRAAFGATPAASADLVAVRLFEPGEAILRADARAPLAAIGARAVAAGRGVAIESRGSDGAARRFDAWELSAARAAAIARAVAAGGLDPARIDVSIAGTRESAGAAGQRLRVTTVSAPA